MPFWLGFSNFAVQVEMRGKLKIGFHEAYLKLNSWAWDAKWFENTAQRGQGHRRAKDKRNDFGETDDTLEKRRTHEEYHGDNKGDFGDHYDPDDVLIPRGTGTGQAYGLVQVGRGGSQGEWTGQRRLGAARRR